ncbi:MAG: hypothetical protein RLZ97_703, partial [Verrucomicrobiota bacterium]
VMNTHTSTILSMAMRGGAGRGPENGSNRPKNWRRGWDCLRPCQVALRGSLICSRSSLLHSNPDLRQRFSSHPLHGDAGRGGLRGPEADSRVGFRRKLQMLARNLNIFHIGGRLHLACTVDSGALQLGSKPGHRLCYGRPGGGTGTGHLGAIAECDDVVGGCRMA